MKRKNWQKLVNQIEYIQQDNTSILDAIEEANWDKYHDLLQFKAKKTETLLKMLIEVLELNKTI